MSATVPKLAGNSTCEKRAANKNGSSSARRKTSAPTLPEKNTFGISCTFTSTHHTGWHFRQLRIYPTSETDPIGGEGTPPRPEPVPTPTPTPRLGLLLSEVMPHPKAGCPEYIELYNASDSPCELGDYALAAGRDGSSYKITPLPPYSIPAGSYIVVTKDPDCLSSCLPRCSSGAS